MIIGIVEFGAGNIASVASAVSRVGATPLIAADAQALDQADAIILPGVGAFGPGMATLCKRGMARALDRWAGHKPILGICLGAQLMCRTSEESPSARGFGWIDADVCRLRPENAALRVPHVGWNDCIRTRQSPLFAEIPDDALFYYVHSYAMVCDGPAAITGACDYGGRFVAAFEQAGLYGVQFHPEKSQRHGLAVLRNFTALVGSHAA